MLKHMKVHCIIARDQARSFMLAMSYSVVNTHESPKPSLAVRQSTAHGVWEVVERQYTSHFLDPMCQTSNGASQLKNNNDSVSMYLRRIKEARDKLAVMGDSNFK